MNTRFAGRKLAVTLLAGFAIFLLCAPLAQAQTAGTGAITGTITDPSGGAVANAAVTATNTGTNQSHDAKTGADGVYKFSLLPPGVYKLHVAASGFKPAEIPSITVNVTETAAANATLEVGAVTESVTVESTVETLQTETSTLGTTVSGSQINALPMANGNYTEILSLSAGTNVGVDNATSVGKGTQDISANGVNPGSNNFQMDGVAVNNIANSGSANDGTIYTGIPIPSTDAIAEFKVQTSTYDASFGRNPGANVTVSTKSGTNDFHGSAFENFRNSVLNSSDYFYNLIPDQPHQILNQNQFGGTIGGPIKKDKLFFFFSYRGTRGKNGVAPQGETFGALLPTSLNPYAALGSRGTCNAPASIPDTGTISAECNATAQAFATAMGIPNGNIVGLRIFQLTTGKNAGVPVNYYIPAPISDPQFCPGGGPLCNFTIPAIYHENQYVANGDWIINSKHTFQTKYFYSANPQTLYVGQNGGDLPGTPEYTPWGNQAAVARLTSTLSNTFINEARVSYQRNNGGASVSVPPGGCPGAGTFKGLEGCGSPDALGMQPLVPGFYEGPTIINIIDNYSLFGGLLPFTGPTNQLQLADQISWQHGRHSIRAGYEYEWTNWPLTDGGLQQGLELVLGAGGALPFLNGLETGGFATSGATAGPGWDVGCLFCVKGITGENGITHFYKLSNQSAYVLDDWKVSSRLTLNMGLRWEFDGLLSDSLGRLTQVWLDRMAPAADVPTSLAQAVVDPASIQQYVVPSNYVAHLGQPPTGVLIANNRNSIEGHTPYSNFAPRFGLAWQPLSNGKLVVRGGVGIFYNRVGLDSVVHAYEQGYPYAATYDYSPPSSRWAAATLTQPYPAVELFCVPSDPNCNSDFGLGFAARFANAATGADSSLSTPFDPNSVHTPLVREYSMGIQYEFAQGWVLDLGYVGSSGINLLDYNHNHNQAELATPTNQFSSLCTGVAPNIICNTAANAQFRVPYPGYQTDGLAGSDANGYSNYNSLQVTVRHNFSHGLTMQAAYTWDKDLTDVFFGPSANINNASCLMCQYGRASFDRPQRFVVSYSYDLPFGKGATGVEGKLISGWNVSGITIAQGGDPLTFISTNNGAAYGTSTTSYLDGVATAQYCPGFNNSNILTSGSMVSRVKNGYFNLDGFCNTAPVAYGDATATGYGDTKVGAVLGPGQFNWDISILKTTNLTERVKMQFRTDFLNAFNHSQFADPGGGSFGTIGFEDIASPSTVQIIHTNVNPRLIQFGLRFSF
ncbi:MAG TPA: carboxypeptidase-like regulatory domain-containing protein [Candidatus Acidoferrum sp.]|nr:carboxypeptidase-like regulatory domain-containing protein [Candidatus Acidoferrum sp.]